MKRCEINTQDTWDLTSLFADQNAYDAQFEQASVLLEELTQFKTHICDTKANFQTFMDKQEQFNRYLDNLVSFPKMATDVDPEDLQQQENLSKAYTLLQKATISLSFVSLECIHNKDQIETWLEAEAFKDYRYPMSELFRTIPHRLSEEQEDLLAKVSELQRIASDTYESFRLTFDDVIVDGKPEYLSDATYSSFLYHKDGNVRKQAFENYFSAYKQYENTFMNLLTGHAKGQVFEAKVRNFDSALQASLFEDGADETLFNKVLYMANDKYHAPLHEYFSFRKQVLQLDTQHVYDIFLPLISSVDIKYSIEDSFAILKQALAPLGEQYVSLLDVAKAERWIDYYPCAGKIGGAYSGGTYDSKPFVLTNFDGTYESLSTLAHELGHSMHSYFSRKNNRPMLAQYKIFVAEVASTVNEILLNEYLLKTSEDKHYKAYLLANLLDQLIGTLYRQPMYALFEQKLHEMIEQEQAISSASLTQLWLDLNKEYFGDGVYVDDLQRYGCYYIPHFYYNFYVYKYTLGMSVALSFAKKILAGDVEEYLTFLSKGGSEAPIDELVHAGVDPRSDEVYDDAFTFFQDKLNELQELLNN